MFEDRSDAGLSIVPPHNNIEKRKALIIALSEYDNSPPIRQLPFCKNDGELISNKLQSLGYIIPQEWKLIGHYTGLQIRKVIIDFFRKKSEAEPFILISVIQFSITITMKILVQ